MVESSDRSRVAVESSTRLGRSLASRSMLVSRDPSIRLRRAVQGEDFGPRVLSRLDEADLTTPRSQEDNLALVRRLVVKSDMRNADRNMHTSLSWAAICGNEELFEWLVIDGGHDDDELSRVSCPSSLGSETVELIHVRGGMQDSENNTILHLLASLPSPALTPAQRLPRFATGCAIRMAGIYYDRCTSNLDCRAAPCPPQLTQSAVSFVLDWANVGGKTAMHVAAQEGNEPFVRVSQRPPSSSGTKSRKP